MCNLESDAESQAALADLVDQSVRDAAVAHTAQLTTWLDAQDLDADRREAARTRLDDLAQSMARLFALSPYLAEACRRDPACLGLRCLDGRLQQSSPPRHRSLAAIETGIREELQQQLLSTGVDPDDWRAREALEMSALRRVRHRELVRVLWREFTEEVPLEETLADLSVLADACIRVATRWSEASQQARHGCPLSKQGTRQRLIVLGMGKLGGHELNVSSDIDLIYLWPAPGETDGRRSVDNAEFFQRVAQRLTRLLSSVTEDGFAYRVDTRLRPFGESGPLVVNFDALEHYWLTQGRDWERYAMIKARPITGDKAAVAELIRLQTPFVYRRYLDYSAIDSLRELKRKIAQSVKQRSMRDNIKLGAGGIREIEFIAQSFQLVRGGRESRLRQRGLQAVFETLRRLDLMPSAEIDELLAAYAFLRRVENGLQAMRDKQTHRLPADELDRHRLVEMLGFTCWSAFGERLASHQQSVSEHFARLFADGEDDDVADTWNVPLAVDVAESDIRQAIAVIVEEAGIEASDGLITALASISRGAPYQRLTARAQQRLDRLMPRLLQAVEEEALPAVALERCLGFVSAVAGRSGYLQVLADRPAVLRRLVHLFAVSPWLSEFVTRHPIVIDELLDTQHEALPTDASAVHALVLDDAVRLRDRDLDDQMDGLRQLRHTRELAIVVAELEDRIELMQVSDQLSWLAEAMVQTVLGLCANALAERHGWPVIEANASEHDTAHASRHNAEPGSASVVRAGVGSDTASILTRIAPRIGNLIGVVAYGKLGGLELGYGSDLDLVFLHADADAATQTDGERPLDVRQWYAKLAQKFVHFMTTLTPAGVLYEIDLRLRPNGSAGVLVSGLSAFERYQREDAWVWEHQALMRGRLVAGGRLMAHRFDRMRRGVLETSRDVSSVREAVASMRAKMRDTLGNREPGRMHLKQDAGGVADIEFVVQYLVLAHAAEHPALVQYTDNVRVLEAVESAGILRPEEARCLKQAYLELRSRLHRLALQQASVIVELDPALEGLRDSVIDIRTRVLGPS